LDISAGELADGSIRGGEDGSKEHLKLENDNRQLYADSNNSARSPTTLSSSQSRRWEEPPDLVVLIETSRHKIITFICEKLEKSCTATMSADPWIDCRFD
jgi:hypothetical protein